MVVRAAVCAVAGVGLISVLLTARGRFVSARNAFAIPLAAWWLSPLAYYYWRVVTVTGAAVIGAGFIVAGAGLLIQIYRSRGSTAAVGLLIAPVLLWPVMIIAVELDRVLAR